MAGGIAVEHRRQVGPHGLADGGIGGIASSKISRASIALRSSPPIFLAR
jgi:hypothetical protein